MKRIIVAYDESPGADAAMRDLVRGGMPEQAEATVLTIADVWVPPETAAEPPSIPDRPTAREGRERALAVVETAREVSARGAEQLRQMFPAWKVQNDAVPDSPAWGILERARQWPADLVVIGSHGRSPLQKFFLGSVSYKVAAEAICSVRVFKAHHRPHDPGTRVIIAYDGSSDSDQAVQEALARQWPADTRFQLVTVIDQKLRSAAFSDAGAFPGAPAESDEALIDLLKKRAAAFSERRFDIAIHVLEGDAKSAILQHASSWEADCIFLGSRGLQHGNRLYLGTLASAILTRTHCTVEIVRPAAR